ncbi:CAP domain-containing protein [Streptomyces sp. NPDC002120]|uniref:CAP domain-containing protein n=1 Tax=Streptomyces sp. NPDC002120 TaxID=3364631 RepID=UPI0036A07788
MAGLKWIKQLWWWIAGGILGWIFRRRGFLWFQLTASDEEKEFWSLINDAREHPQKYPPHGNTSGAVMSACPSGFRFSGALTETARNHNVFLSGKDKNWVSTGDNMHRGPSGKLVWDDGEPMAEAGYNPRKENVAVGFSTPEQAVRFWMQDDEVHAWGHRNAILNCSISEGGVGHYPGGPWGHYWTLDMGVK